MSIERVAVLGAGTMGGGIAAQLVLSGFQVDLFDPDEVALDRAAARVAKRQDASERPGTGALAGLHRDVASAVEAAEFVIEAAPEIIELKRDIFAQVDEAAPEGAVLASNTSELSVTFIAAATGRPESVLGMHWFNPPERMQLIELVRAVRTSDHALGVASDVARRCGKTVVTVEDRQGFVTTRVVAAVLLEGVRLLEEGVASRDDIDTAVKLGLNHPMGPLELADYIGLDTVVFIAESLTEAYGERFRAPQTLKRLVESGRKGRKGGGGFYDEA